MSITILFLSPYYGVVIVRAGNLGHDTTTRHETRTKLKGLSFS